jgi:glyoxylase-like metal-dependent hydrolase (beta-lactamase superfamily II)
MVGIKEVNVSATRQPGKITQNTTLIDIGMQGSYGITAVYLIRGARTCLIDGGTRTEAPRLVKMLTELNAFPPDLIVVTHPHWDHAQGIPLLRQEATKRGRKIEVLAGQDAVAPLADASFNAMFGRGPIASIQDVTPLKEGDAIDLGGVSLRIYDVPGHCRGHIAILDESNANIFVGDAIGLKVSDDISLPPFMPPTWDPQAFLASVDKLRQTPYETLCLAHFGCIRGNEAKSILDEAVRTCDTWWQFYARHADRLSDLGHLLQCMRKEISLGIPPLKPTSLPASVLLGVVTAVGAAVGRRTAIVDRLAFGDMLRWLATGYTMYASAH